MQHVKWLSILLVLAMLAIPVSVGAQTPCNGTTYVVKTGDNLFRIGLAYGLTADQVAAANGITNVNQVGVATVLCIPTGNFGTGGPTNQGTTTTTAPVAPHGTNPDANTTLNVVGGPININSTTFRLDLAANSVTVTVGAGTLDVTSGYSTTATIALDATNNVLGVTTIGMIPNAQARVYVSPILGDISGGVAGVLMADSAGVVNGYVEIPFISSNVRQYVMIRAYDGRMTWGYFDLGARFP